MKKIGPRNLERMIVYPLALILLGVFSFYDLPISESVADRYGDVLGIIGSLYGEQPFTFLTAVGTAFLFRYRPRRTKAQSIALGILFALCLAGLSLYGGYMLQHYPEDYGVELPFYLIFIFAIVYALLALLIAYSLKAKDPGKVFSASLVNAVFFIAVVIVLMNVLKPIWGRPRYRFLISEENEGYSFMPWYAISIANPKDDSFYSFPSGHTMNATGILCLSLYCRAFRSRDVGYFYLRMACFAYIVIVAVSRVYNAAHFASDVTAGFLLAYLSLDLLESLLYPWLCKRFDAARNGKAIEEDFPSA